MQQFTVPQFIDVEGKIIGPITTRQFLIFLGAAVVIGLSYRLFDFSLFLAVSIVAAMIAVVFAFVKVNGRPFHFFVLNFVQTLGRPHTRMWHKNLEKVEVSENTPMAAVSSKAPSKEYYKKSKLAELALVVDTKGRYKGSDDEDDNSQPGNKE